MNNTKIEQAIEILKSTSVTGIGKCRAYVSETNANDIEIFTESGYYCTINVRSRMIREA